MSILDLDGLTDQRLIAQFVLEHRNQGHVLPYEDYDIINGWLRAARHVDDVLLILSDLLPRIYDRPTERRHPPSLRCLNKQVLKKIKETALRAP